MGGHWYIYGYTKQSTKQNSESEGKILERSATSRVRTSDLLAEGRILLRLSYGGCRLAAMPAAYPKLGENSAPFWPSIFRGSNCHHAGLADLWPSMAPSQVRVPQPEGYALPLRDGGQEAPPDA